MKWKFKKAFCCGLKAESGKIALNTYFMIHLGRVCECWIFFILNPFRKLVINPFLLNSIIPEIKRLNIQIVLSNVHIIVSIPKQKTISISFSAFEFYSHNKPGNKVSSFGKLGAIWLGFRLCGLHKDQTFWPVEHQLKKFNPYTT